MRPLFWGVSYFTGANMDLLLKAATEYSELFGKIYQYTLETNEVIHVQFTPGYFHHLLGLQKLSDVAAVTKSLRNKPAYIFKNIKKGIISLEDIQKSKYFF